MPRSPGGCSNVAEQEYTHPRDMPRFSAAQVDELLAKARADERANSEAEVQRLTAQNVRFAEWMESADREAYRRRDAALKELAEERAKRPDREQLEAILDEVFPPVEPRTPRSSPMRGDDDAVDARNDERFAVDRFIDALLDSLALEPEAREVADAWHGDPDNVQLYNRDGSKRPWDEVLAEITEKRKALDASEAAAAVTDG